MSPTPRVANSFGIRAINTIERLLCGVEPVKHPYLRCPEEVDVLTRRGLRLRLHALAVQSGHGSIGRLLLTQRNCGRHTVVEILTWIGLQAQLQSHTCVCRTCGRRSFGGAPGPGAMDDLGEQSEEAEQRLTDVRRSMGKLETQAERLTILFELTETYKAEAYRLAAKGGA